MKRFCAIVALSALVLSLAACGRADDQVTFYYARRDDQFRYGQADGVIAGENREISGHADDLRYLLILYFHGPTSEALRSPFPSGTSLKAVARQGDTIYIELSSIVSIQQGIDLTLACACLAQTCFSITDARNVSISSEGLGLVSMTLSRDSLMLVDDSGGNLSETCRKMSVGMG